MEEKDKYADEPAEDTSPQDTVSDVVTFGNRSFDISTAEGKRDLEIYLEAFSHMAGKHANELGSLRQEVEPLRRYGIKRPSQDKVEIMKEVERLHEEGESKEAMRLMFNYVEQVEADNRARAEEARLWSDYVTSRKELFDDLDEQVYKDYIFRNYRGELEEAQDPFDLLDRILTPKMRKKAKKADDDTYATVRGSEPRREKKKAEDKPKSGSWDAMLDEFGFK